MNRKQQDSTVQTPPEEPLIGPEAGALDHDGHTWSKMQARSRVRHSRPARRANQIRVGSRLVESFSEFLSSRNVMRDKQPKYNRMTSSCQPIRCSSWLDDCKRARNTCTCSAASGGSTRSRVGKLLGALLSSRGRAGKLGLLVGLLRAPIVLAALFSLALIASLMVLYGLSLAHHLQSNGWQMLGSKVTNFPQQVSSHKISSRQAEDGFNRALTVQTECGIYIGSPDEGAAIKFMGIRYASAPIGPRRWRKPNPIWTDAELCKPEFVWPELGQSLYCAQVSPMTPGQFSGSEDCLYLDIYTPKLGDRVKVSRRDFCRFLPLNLRANDRAHSFYL